MTEAELDAIVEGIVPVLKEKFDGLALEVTTLREALLAQKRALETRTAELELRCSTLEGRALVAETQVQNLEAHLAAVR